MVGYMINDISVGDSWGKMLMPTSTFIVINSIIRTPKEACRMPLSTPYNTYCKYKLLEIDFLRYLGPMAMNCSSDRLSLGSTIPT